MIWRTLFLTLVFCTGNYGQGLARKGNWSKNILQHTGYEGVALRAWHVSNDGQSLWVIGVGRSNKPVILYSEDGGINWRRKSLQTKLRLSAVFATDDGAQVWVASVSNEPDPLTSAPLAIGTLFQSNDRGDHWNPVPGISSAIHYLTGTPDGKHVWALGTYTRKLHNKGVSSKSAADTPKVLTRARPEDVADAIIQDNEMRDRLFRARYGHKLYHLVDGALELQMASLPFEFDEYRHGIAASADGTMLSAFGHLQGRSGTSVLCSVDGGKTGKGRVDIFSTLDQLFRRYGQTLYVEGGNAATATADSKRIAITDGTAAFYSGDSGVSWLATPLARGGFDLLKLMRSQLWLLSHDGEFTKVPLGSLKALSAFRPDGFWH